MDSVTLKDFRCFRGEQTARMAPLTLLVGENSTGKTSFLAILRALWEVAVNELVPDFRRDPYDLGAFSEIVYNDSSRGEQPDAFEAGFRHSSLEDFNEAVSFRFTFQDIDGVPFPVSRCVLANGTSLQVTVQPDDKVALRIDLEGRSWKDVTEPVGSAFRREWLVPFDNAMVRVLGSIGPSRSPVTSVRELAESYAGPSLDEGDIEQVAELRQRLISWQFHKQTPYAGAPVRSKPRRTYDPSRPITDPEGEYIPSYLSMMSRHEPDRWKNLKKRLERFGTDSGLFDEISVESFGQKSDSTPFQIQIRKFGGKAQGQPQEPYRCWVRRQPSITAHH